MFSFSCYTFFFPKSASLCFFLAKLCSFAFSIVKQPIFLVFSDKSYYFNISDIEQVELISNFILF